MTTSTMPTADATIDKVLAVLKPYILVDSVACALVAANPASARKIAIQAVDMATRAGWGDPLAYVYQLIQRTGDPAGAVIHWAEYMTPTQQAEYLREEGAFRPDLDPEVMDAVHAGRRYIP